MTSSFCQPPDTQHSANDKEGGEYSANHSQLEHQSAHNNKEEKVQSACEWFPTRESLGFKPTQDDLNLMSDLGVCLLDDSEPYQIPPAASPTGSNLNVKEKKEGD